MKKYLSVFLVIASALVGVTAQAQQCYQAPCNEYVAPCCPAVCCDASPVYASVFGGANWLNQHKKHSVTNKFHVGYTVGGAVGYRFDRTFRAEAEVSYRNNRLDYLKHCGEKTHPKGRVESLSVMANGYYDFNLDSCFTPYVGLGIGYNEVKARVSSNEDCAHGRNYGIAGQAIVGVSKRIFCRTDLGVEYRYFASKASYHEQSVNLSLRHAF